MFFSSVTFVILKVETKDPGCKSRQTGNGPDHEYPLKQRNDGLVGQTRLTCFLKGTSSMVQSACYGRHVSI